MRRALLVAVACLLGAHLSYAQDDSKFKPSAQVRYRFESGGRDFDKSTPNRNFSLLRSRIGVKFTPEENMDIVVMLQDARFMGEETHTLLDGNADHFDMREGYMKLRQFIWKPMDLKLGRMRVKYGEERIIGAVEWTNIGRSFDGAIVTLNSRRVSADLFAFAEVESLLVGDDGDLHVFGVNVDLPKLGDTGKTQLYVVGQVNDPLERLNRWTGGYYLNGKIGNLEFISNGALQWGTLTPDSVKQDVEAYMLTGEARYRLAAVAGRPGLAAGVEYLSGDDDLEDANYKVFDTLYATNHKFYGLMDYFLNIPLNTFGRGLVDVFARAMVDLGSVPIRLDVHVFTSAQNYTLASDETSKSFGAEIDLTFKYDYNQYLTIWGGASVFEPGDIFKDARDAKDMSNWAYLMLIANI